jgi:uncharacterized protein (TIGR00661 family)
MMQRKTILVAPLNWGLGHAARCIPIINELIIHGYKVVIASDGEALALLRKEFPNLTFFKLPSYDIKYPVKGANLKWKLLSQVPHIIKNISAEKKVIEKIINKHTISGIISDNRWGVRHKKIPSVFLTHQLNVLSGTTSALSSLLHQKLIEKFDECWIPDNAKTDTLSGKLGHVSEAQFITRYIGPLSRLMYKEVPIKYDLLILLSGPEPQRSILEEKLLKEFTNENKRIIMIRGVVEAEEKRYKFGNIEVVNYLKTDDLATVINKSDLVLSRAGYTTIMDLSVMQKKAFFIPTPGQYEQKYLAKILKDKGLVPSCSQAKFKAKKLNKITKYKGLQNVQANQDFGKLFSLFHSK